MVVNLNTLCKVQLTPAGKIIWLSQIDEFPEETRKAHPEIEEHIRGAIDERGYIEAELWVIMNVFGQYISPMKSAFTSTTIELNKNPNFGNFFNNINKEETKNDEPGTSD